MKDEGRTLIHVLFSSFILRFEPFALMTALSQLWPNITRIASAEEIIRIGAADLDDVHAALFDEWIATGHHASMGYLAKNRETRLAPRTRFP